MALSAVSSSSTGRPVVRLLDPHTVNQIAAGEVVERPAAALKELIENALDAGATSVEVTLLDAGRKLMEIADNGHGMDAETLAVAMLRHATSKIESADDLHSVASFGFRGEALPSIASVSRMVVETGIGEGARTRWVVEAGEAEPMEQIPGPRGTTVSVHDLFGNVPARLKFLKSDATELSACVEVVSKCAIARPDVAFTLRHHGSVLLRTAGAQPGDGGDEIQQRLNALADVWGRDAARALVPVEIYNGSARVTGFVSPPHFTKPTRSMQWFFVNGRPVRSRVMVAAVDQAYRSLTPDRRFPVVALMIEVDPARIDVNVSPTKSEVKFHQEGGVFDAIRRGIKDALLAHGMVPTVEEVTAANDALLQARGEAPFQGHFARDLAPGGSFAVPDSGVGTPWGLAMSMATVAAQAPLAPGVVGESSTQGFDDLLEDLRILGQVDDTFIIAENRSSLLIIDQHVAHERILYEMLCNTRGAAPIEVQTLLSPETLHVSPSAMPAMLEHLPELQRIGFDLEPFGGDSFLVRAVPALGRGKKALQVLQDLADELADGVGRPDLVPTRDDVYIMCSCKMAIKAGDRLAPAEMHKLIEDLAKTENPYLCPHGRPITIVMPKSDLRKRFKR